MDWATINLSPEDAEAFEAVANGLHVAPDELLRRLALRVVEADRTARSYGLSGLAYWTTGDQALRITTDYPLDVLPVDIRETEFMWPPDLPFPWTAEHCKAAVLGYQVRWGGDFDDFLQKLRGKWEMIDGYAVLHQS